MPHYAVTALIYLDADTAEAAKAQLGQSLVDLDFPGGFDLDTAEPFKVCPHCGIALPARDHPAADRAFGCSLGMPLQPQN